MKSEKIKHNSAKRLDDVFHLSRCKKKESLYYLSNFLYLLANREGWSKVPLFVLGQNGN
jgi:hypothetical protein